ncbi:MAG TPA: helix-turn-helix domain-containing protein, partial [Candidatus Methylacidiphilales bacterium]
MAEKAGVHRATVSLVLKNHPSIPEATRQKVLAAAKEMGYERDPMLSVLAAYRNGLAHHAMHGELAWLAFHDWGRAPIYDEYFAGARNRAKECGYILEKFEAFAKGMTV